MAHDELEFVEWLRRNAPTRPEVLLGIGDDMGAVSTPDKRFLMSCDLLLDGVHVDSRRHSYADIGRKALARNLSDCAAMAVRPLAATVSVALPRCMTLEDAKALAGGVFALAREFEVAVIGGDTTRWDHPLAIDVAVTAVPYEGIRPITRAGARAGDRLFVTGKLGGSLRGRHLTFVPRVREAYGLAQKLGTRLHAMIDISDGLSLDLWRVCQASGVGAELNEEELRRVIHADAVDDGRTPLDHALGDGEDFELLFAAEAENANVAGMAHPIGWVVETGLYLRDLDGVVTPLEPRGYVH